MLKERSVICKPWGTSQAIEGETSVLLLKCSVSHNQLEYSTYIGDGGSSSIKKFQDQTRKKARKKFAKRMSRLCSKENKELSIEKSTNYFSLTK